MRTIAIVIFLVLLNGSAVMVSEAGIGQQLGVEPVIGGEEQIQSAEESVGQIDTDRSQFDVLSGGVMEAISVLQTVFAIATAGPAMIINLGGPLVAPFVVFLSAPLYIIVGIDVLNTLSGGRLG